MIMAPIKTALIGFISLFLVFPAQAENWVEVTAVGQGQSFYDSDSAFVDYYSGLVIVEMATWLAENDDFSYIMEGFDCSRWEFYFVALSTPEGWQYDVNQEFGVTPLGDPTSPLSKAARWACDNYNLFPKNNLPFVFELSR
ncbi:MAG: hypothetical protein V3R64_04970 [Sphingomonadales bacterium]